MLKRFIFSYACCYLVCLLPYPAYFLTDLVFAESADALINDGKYNKALDILKTIVINEKRTNKIPPMIQKLSCEIDERLYSDAKTTGREIANLIESKEFEKKENNHTKQIYHNKLHSIAMKLIKIKHFDLALLLVEIQLNLIKHSYSVQEKLTKLQNLGISLTDISKNLHYKKDLKKVKEIYLLYDKVLNDMQSINDIDLKIKTENIAWFMYYYGTGCNFMKDFNKSMVIFPKAIFLMKANLSDNANNYVVYGICHHNYANVLIETKRLIEAKERFEEALKIFEEATDWPNEEQKINKFIITISAIDEINFRLTSNKRSWLNRLAHLCLYTAQNIRHALKRE